jgi:transcriptional regulator with XRE-family HTH domain
MTEPEAIEAKRKQLNISKAAFCRFAGISRQAYWRALAGPRSKWRRDTLRKIERALDSRPTSAAARKPASAEHLATIYRAFVVIIAGERGIDPEAVFASSPQARANTCPEWRAAARIRELAVACVTAYLDAPAARVGRAIGLTRAAVSQINRRVEDMRDDPEIDALLERIGPLVSGRE